MSIQKLVGKKIKIMIAEEDKIVFLTEDNETLRFDAVGDCCSSSYIESIDNPEIFNGATVTKVDVVSGEVDDVDDFEVHKWTFYKFTTTKGMATLSFRNESNGYYDGWLELNGG